MSQTLENQTLSEEDQRHRVRFWSRACAGHPCWARVYQVFWCRSILSGLCKQDRRGSRGSWGSETVCVCCRRGQHTGSACGKPRTAGLLGPEQGASQARENRSESRHGGTRHSLWRDEGLHLGRAVSRPPAFGDLCHLVLVLHDHTLDLF